MPDPYLGEIRLLSFGFAPRGWAACDGAEYPINSNQALFALLGTTYGGDGQTTFALPDLRGRVPVGWGEGSMRGPGQTGGEETHTLTVGEIPTHVHLVRASSADEGGTDNPTDSFPGGAADLYHSAESMTPMHPGTVAVAGRGTPHPNMQPFLALHFCIATQGIYPPKD